MINAVKPSLFRLSLLLVLMILMRPASASDGLANVQRLVFVAGRDTTSVVAVRTDTDTLVGGIDLGVVPRGIQVSEALAKLVAIDGKSPGVFVADLASGFVSVVPLRFVPVRLVLTTDGRTAIAAKDETGEIALLDLAALREKVRIDGPTGIRDLMARRDGRSIFIAAESVEGVAVYNVSTGKRTSIIGRRQASALARSLVGHDGFALSAEDARDARFVTRFDMETGAFSEMPGRGAAIYPAIRWLLLPDPASRTVDLLPLDGGRKPTRFGADASVYAAYSGLFDTVAFVPGAKSVFVYDLDRLKPLDEISLPGAPGPGVVTPESTKLYLPVADARELLVIDAASRAVAGRIKLDFSPSLAVMAGGYGVCH
ncbi:hypothetical protein [Rhodomicrobium lacus]|uniref:hypothetical protein n=1 Tax=Rhodomicrobium lacus TaxID=2498452 RepID=UPI0026E1544A|nr:hypothetical protein [Rhodomicrobium lacus]WKW51932.1 hypothetical protein QMO75_05490 [Rhodomicrobium lacus]